MLRNAKGGGEGGGGVCDPLLRIVTRGWGGVLILVLRNSCLHIYILPDNCIVPCRFALIQNEALATQHLKLIRNGVCCCYRGYLPFKRFIITFPIKAPRACWRERHYCRFTVTVKDPAHWFNGGG